MRWVALESVSEVRSVRTRAFTDLIPGSAHVYTRLSGLDLVLTDLRRASFIGTSRGTSVAETVPSHHRPTPGASHYSSNTTAFLSIWQQYDKFHTVFWYLLFMRLLCSLKMLLTLSLEWCRVSLLTWLVYTGIWIGQWIISMSGLILRAHYILPGMFVSV
jgi:hypothetical protein